jgi:hypothetical protein
MSAPLSALTATWNNVATVFTAIKMTVTDTASAAKSKLLDLVVGSTSMFSVQKDGQVAAVGRTVSAPDGIPGTVAINDDNLNFTSFPTSTPFLAFAETDAGNTNIYDLIGVSPTFQGERIPVMSWASISDIITTDLGLYWNTGAGGTGGANVGFEFHIAAGVLLDPTYTIGSYEWDDGSAHHMNLSWVPAASLFQFGRDFNPTSPTASGNDCSAAIRYGVSTVAGLPSAVTVGAGARAFATDLTSTTRAATATGGGALKWGVHSDGTNWIVD